MMKRLIPIIMTEMAKGKNPSWGPVTLQRGSLRDKIA
jgi:hypothetical protein